MQGQGQSTERIKKRKEATLEIKKLLNIPQDDKRIRGIQTRENKWSPS